MAVWSDQAVIALVSTTSQTGQFRVAVVPYGFGCFASFSKHCKLSAPVLWPVEKRPQIRGVALEARAESETRDVRRKLGLTDG